MLDTSLPTPRGEERLFYERARAHELVYQVCQNCRQHWWYLRTVCPACLATELTLTPSSGTGTVYSYTTLYRAGTPSRAGDVPYTIALVDLDEGVRVIGDLCDVEPNKAAIGMRVQVVYLEMTDEITRIGFTPQPTITER